MEREPVKTIKIFYCYAHKDQLLRDELERHLGTLKRLNQITSWYDREIQAGTDWEQEIETQLTAANIILLLISADFISSDYCYTKEMKKALELQNAGHAYVVPIILRPVDWRGTPIAKLQALPSNGQPVISSYWHDLDEALEDVARNIRSIVEVLLTQSGEKLLMDYHKKLIKPHERGSRKTTPLGLMDIRKEVFSEKGDRKHCPYCGASLLSAIRYCIDWNEERKEFQVMIVYDAKCLDLHCPGSRAQYSEEDFVIKGLPLIIAQESSCSCGAKLSLGSYTLQKRENALEFNAIYTCEKCFLSKKTIFSDLMCIVANIWKNNLWKKVTKVEIGPSGLKYDDSLSFAAVIRKIVTGHKD
jgi:hypothetical protein